MLYKILINFIRVSLTTYLKSHLISGATMHLYELIKHYLLKLLKKRTGTYSLHSRRKELTFFFWKKTKISRDLLWETMNNWILLTKENSWWIYSPSSRTITHSSVIKTNIFLTEYVQNHALKLALIMSTFYIYNNSFAAGNWSLAGAKINKWTVQTTFVRFGRNPLIIKKQCPKANSEREKIIPFWPCDMSSQL